MNAERLHVLADELRDEIRSGSIDEKLSAIVSTLRRQVDQPGQPQYEKQLAELIKEIRHALAAVPSNEFSPLWTQTMEELGIHHLFGNALARRINSIFARNQITPSVALSELEQDQKALSKLVTSLDGILEAFHFLKIGSEQLKPGECEVSVLVPRDFVDNHLKDFGKEMVELDKIIGPFSELTTGSRPGIAIRTISSSDLSVFLGMDLDTCATIAFAVGYLIDKYKNLLDIRRHHAELREQKVPKDSLKGLEEYARKFMAEAIEEIADELLGRQNTANDAARTNELKIELRIALRKLANRIDCGFNIDVRYEPLSEEEENRLGPKDVESRSESTQLIDESSKLLSFIKTKGEPLLCLPDSPDEVKEETELREKTKPKPKEEVKPKAKRKTEPRSKDQ